MKNKQKPETELTAAEFMARHQRELAQTEDVIGIRQLEHLIPPRKSSLSWLMIPSPERDAWLQAREALPGYRLMQQLRKYPIVRLLKAARKENSPAAYGELLEGLVTKLGVEAPDGVFLPVRHSRGAPRKTSTEQIHLVWLQNGKPAWAALAHLYYRADYTNANTQLRKKLSDSCRRAVARWQTELARQCGQDACD